MSGLLFLNCLYAGNLALMGVWRRTLGLSITSEVAYGMVASIISENITCSTLGRVLSTL